MGFPPEAFCARGRGGILNVDRRYVRPKKVTRGAVVVEGADIEGVADGNGRDGMG